MKSIQILSAALILSQQCNLSAARSLLRKRDSDNNVNVNPSSNNRELNTRIINGFEATEDRYSYAVSLRDSIGHFCGGSLIAKDVILTAAHCKGGNYNVVMGRHDWNDNDGQVIAKKSELSHPDYNARSTDNDFMLVFLNRATTASNVDLVSLNSRAAVPSVGQGVTVMGWGDTDIRDTVSELSNVLMNVNVKAITNQDCDDSEGTINGFSDNYNDRITENMLCARANQRDSCQGDSGGPLVIKGGNAGADVQVGVVSWGVGCASQHFPGVYSRVSRAYDWIESEICEGSKYASEAGFDCSSGTGSNDSIGLLAP
mmetsp:Transcript_32351/g.68054  ORF Transcript_32351/g.68054 Transcript_32351/m.68054 type:complete len:315 (+) Transcript_32351:247-1191(+)|eukprot:CAMPEP_0172303802 /NCGR_PEP_ID=MMETSP1058-20130122/5324_1 /TAXON_ID=83371 /ORGANISM="Detonula confervacea, Strain CCMP 353" /LENGTH=314 /DNA_ID=CAMNT_0013014793 /DNA_START=161 /DNA_END=1101 /DNA_ORIENTATION=+